MKYTQLSRKNIYKSPWINLYQDKIKLSDGNIIDDFHVVDFGYESIGSIVTGAKGEILLIKEYRYPTDTISWEIPAGGIDAGETPIQAATREIHEETGYESCNHKLLYSYFPTNGNCTQKFHITSCKINSKKQQDITNDLRETKWFSKEEITTMLSENKINNGLTLTAILMHLIKI